MIQKIAKWYLIRWWYIRCDHSRSFKNQFYHMQLDYHDGLVQFLKSNIQNISKKGIFRWQWCWWHRDVGVHFKMLVKKSFLVTFQLVTNIIICQNVMLVTDIWCWCLTLNVGDVTCHQHISSPSSVVTRKNPGKLFQDSRRG